MSGSQEKPVFGRRKPPANVDPESATQSTSNGDTCSSAQVFTSAASKLQKLLETPYEKRDGRWNYEFSSLLENVGFVEYKPELKGPMGLRSYAVSIAADGQGNAMKFKNLAKKATKEGMGVALFRPGNATADFVFTFGQMYVMATSGKLDPLNTFPRGSTGFREDPDRPIPLVMPVPETILPQSARESLRRFFAENYNMYDVGVCFRVERDDTSMRTLVFDIDRESFRDSGEASVLLQALWWFVPPSVQTGIFEDIDLDRYEPI